MTTTVTRADAAAMEIGSTAVPSMWLAGVRAGIAMLPREPVLGAKRIVLPVSYWRAVEFAYVWRRLGVARGARVLDVGSPKDLAIHLARHRALHVVSTDILEEEVASSRRSASAQRLDARGAGTVEAEVQDGRALTYPDASFDAAFSVSVLEHIPERGDSDAIAELLRVVRPGGRVVVTTPFSPVYRETFVEGPVYERQEASRNFFERHYDMATLRERLWSVPGAVLEDVELWGERALRGERILTRSGALRTILSPLEALLASLCLRRLDAGEDGHPMAVFFTLRKG